MASAVQYPFDRPRASVMSPITTGPKLYRAATKKAGRNIMRSPAAQRMPWWLWKTSVFHAGSNLPPRSAKLNNVNKAIGYLHRHQAVSAASFKMADAVRDKRGD